MVALDRYAVACAADLQDKLKTLYQNYEFHTIYQLLFNFCSVTMGSFYLDVIKDRQYTIAKEAAARRSAQTAIYHILEAMVRWLAPILSFTAEEIWQHLPGEREESVFLTTFYDKLIKLDNATLSMEEWQTFLTVREAVNAEIEKARNESICGSSLEAAVSLTLPAEEYAVLAKLGEELKFGLIVSAVHLVRGETRQITVSKAEGEKCERCWHVLPDVGTHAEHPTLCARCIENVDGTGETRSYL